jgi:hypothetical protein
MKECTREEYALIMSKFRREDEKIGSFSVSSTGELLLTLRDKTLPVYSAGVDFLDIVGGGRITLEKRVEVVAESVSKPKWDVYAVYDSERDKNYYNTRDVYMQSIVEGESWYPLRIIPKPGIEIHS